MTNTNVRTAKIMQHATSVELHPGPLTKLRDSNLMLDDRTEDIRDRKVIDEEGDEIGTVSALFVDEDESKVRFLEVSAGGFLGLGKRAFLIPVDVVTRLTAEAVHVNQSRDRVIDAPSFDPVLNERPAPELYAPYYGYYGISPYWAPGYRYPRF